LYMKSISAEISISVIPSSWSTDIECVRSELPLTWMPHWKNIFVSELDLTYILWCSTGSEWTKSVVPKKCRENPVKEPQYLCEYSRRDSASSQNWGWHSDHRGGLSFFRD
jgi:hypothetical protein